MFDLTLDSLTALLDAAACSPTAAVRATSFGYLFDAAAKRPSVGQRSAVADMLPALAQAARDDSRSLAGVEDFIPLDPRLMVRLRWRGGLFDVVPGTLERPLADLEYAMLVADTIDQSLVPRNGYGLGDVVELVLRRHDHLVRRLASAWPVGAVSGPEETPCVTVGEVEAVASAPGLRRIVDECTDPVRAAAALAAYTVRPRSLRFDPSHPVGPFGAALAVTVRGQVVSLPAANLIEAVSVITAQLAARVVRIEPGAAFAYAKAVVVKVGDRLAGSGVEFAGPERVDPHGHNVFLVRYSGRRFLALDVVASLTTADAQSVLASPDPLPGITPGSFVPTAAGTFRLPPGADVARARLVARPHDPAPLFGAYTMMTLADFDWILYSTQQAPEEFWFFARDLERNIGRSFAWDLIDRFEVWHEQGTFYRGGVPLSAMMFEPHAAAAEWDDAAAGSKLEAALFTLGLRPLRSWPIRAVDAVSVEVGDLRTSESYQIVADHRVSFAVARVDAAGPDEIAEQLWHLAGAAAWKVEHILGVFVAAAQASGLTGVVVRFAFDPSPDGQPLKFGSVDGSHVEIVWARHLETALAADASAVEAALGELVSQVFTAEARAGFVAAWNAAPPGIRLDGYTTVQDVNRLPEPLKGSRSVRADVLRELGAHLRRTGTRPARMEGAAATQFESTAVFPWLIERLHRALADLDPQKLLAYALNQLERAHHQRWLVDKQLGWQLGFPVGVSSNTQERRTTASKMVRVVSLMVEEILARPPSGSGRVDEVAWTEALAVGELCIESCLRSDAVHHRLRHVVVEVTGQFEVNEDWTTALTDVDYVAYTDERNSATLPQPVPISNITTPPPTAPPTATATPNTQPYPPGPDNRTEPPGRPATTPGPDTTDPGHPDAGQPHRIPPLLDQLPALASIDDALRQELTFGLDALLGVLRAGVTWKSAPPLSTDLSTADQVLDTAALAVPYVPRSEIAAALNWMTLRGSDLAGDTIPHWEVEQRLKRVLTSPFVSTEHGLWVLPWACGSMFDIVFNYLEDGRIPWPNDALPQPVKKALSQYRHVRNIKLETDAAAQVGALGLTVRHSVLPAKRRHYGLKELYGEIDVLAVDVTRHRIWVIEAKDPYAPFSSRQVRRLIDSFNGRDGHIAKLLRKTENVRNCAQSVATALGVADQPQQWEVVPLMLTRHVEPAAFATEPVVAFCTLEQLAEVAQSDEAPEPGWHAPSAVTPDHGRA